MPSVSRDRGCGQTHTHTQYSTGCDCELWLTIGDDSTGGWWHLELQEGGRPGEGKHFNTICTPHAHT